MASAGSALASVLGVAGTSEEPAVGPAEMDLRVGQVWAVEFSYAKVRVALTRSTAAELAYAVAILDRGEGIEGRFHADVLALDFDAGRLAGNVTLQTAEDAGEIPAIHDLAVSRDGGWLFVAGATTDAVAVLPLADGLGAASQEPLVVGRTSVALRTRTRTHRELCDGVDQDCDGGTDEDFAAGEPCAAPGVCGPGVLRCQPDPLSEAVCSTAPGQPGSPALDTDPCDGADNDCDGETDEDLNIGEPFRVGEPGALARMPDVAFVQTGPIREFAVVWQQGAQADSEIRFRRISLDGEAPADEEPVASGEGGAHMPRIAWNGEEHGLIWSLGGGTPVDVRFRRVPFSGRDPGDELELGRPARPWIGVASTEGGWAVATSDSLWIVRPDDSAVSFAIGGGESSQWQSVGRGDDGGAVAASLRTPSGAGGCGGNRRALTLTHCDGESLHLGE